MSQLYHGEIVDGFQGEWQPVTIGDWQGFACSSYGPADSGNRAFIAGERDANRTQ